MMLRIKDQIISYRKGTAGRHPMAKYKGIYQSIALLVILICIIQYFYLHLNLKRNSIKQEGILGILSNQSKKIVLPLCPSPPPTLRGYAKVVLSAPSLDAISRLHPEIELGGHYRPPKCRSRDKVAIILPFRDREEHLRLFLFNLHPLLQRQQIEYNIFVIEQGGHCKAEPFNRAMLFNVGFVEASKRADFDCYIFHDVDLIPENDHNLYNCPEQPRHMSVAVDKMNYKLPYNRLFGGVSALKIEHFIKVNGFSNVFWGWGAEDDDMANRIEYHGLQISRPSPDIARYKMLKHKQQNVNKNGVSVLNSGKERFTTDGLNNLNYTVEQITLEKLYTFIRVQLYVIEARENITASSTPTAYSNSTKTNCNLTISVH